MNTTTITAALIAEPPLLVLPSLAVAVGLNQAIIIQQLHFMTRIRRPDRNGYRWVALSGGDLEHTFPFWGRSTIWRSIWQARDAGLLVVNPDAGEANSYRIDYDAVSKAVDKSVDKTPEPANNHVQIEHSGVGNPVQIEHATMPNLNIPTTKEFKRENLYTKGGQEKAGAEATAAAKPETEPSPMLHGWKPDQAAVDEIHALGITDAFITQVLPEFRMYWMERGNMRTWGGTFVAHCRRQWGNKPAQATRATPPTTPAERKPYVGAAARTEAERRRRKPEDPTVGKNAIAELAKKLRIAQ